MVADAQALEQNRPFDDVLSAQVADFRGSFSGYERDRLFYNPNGSFERFVQSAYVFGLDSDHDGRSVAPVDIDGDGDLDLALLSVQGLRLLENTSAPQHFARVRLTAADRHAPVLGAIVELQAGGVTRRDFVRITEGFRTQVPSDLHFGLGSTATIDSLEVRWPSGHVDRWTDVPADRLLLVGEGNRAIDARPLGRWPDGSRPRLTRLPSPTVVAQRLEGGTRPIAGGRPAVINFWAPWCAPCNVELPQLVHLAERYAGETDFAGVSVEVDDLDSVYSMLEKFDIPYLQFLADDRLMERFFGSGEIALPSTFVFDAAGRLRRLFRGAIAEADLDALLRSFQDEGLTEASLSLAARLAFEAGDYDKAVEHYSRLAALEPESLLQVGADWEHRRAVDQFRLGVARFRSGRFAQAVIDLQGALGLLGKEHVVLLRLGIAAARANQLDIAADALARAVRADPASVPGWIHKARVHSRMGETAAAMAGYDRALSLDPGSVQARQERDALEVIPRKNH